MEYEQVLSDAIALFDGNQIAAAAPLYTDGASKLGAAFTFSQVGFGPRDDGVPAWMAIRGVHKDTHIVSATGTEMELVVQVEGETLAARQALQAVWQHLAPGARPIEEVAMIVDRTTATLALPFEFEEIFPVAAQVRDTVVDYLRGHDGHVALAPMFKFHVEITCSVGARAINQNVTIEPRATARTGRRIFFTQSPLPSDKHRALLEELVRRATGGLAGSGA